MKEKFENFLVTVLVIITLPIVLIWMLAEGFIMFLCGKKSKTSGKTDITLGVIISQLPAICLLLFFIWLFGCWIYCAFSEVLRIGHPVLIFFGIICPVVGGLFILLGCMKGD